MSNKASKSANPDPAGAPAKPAAHARGKIPWLPSSWRFSWGTPLRLIFLAVLVLTVWQVVHDRVDFASWKTPLAYDGDSVQILGWIKASSEGDFLPFHSKITTRLGAPYQANWNDYAIYEEFLVFTLGRLTNWIGLGAASNVGVAMSYVFSVLAFYACSRLLRHRKEWAMVFGILFAFSYYSTYRGLPHLLLSYTYTVPLALVSIWLVLASKRIRRWNALWWFCLGVGLIIGLNNPYNVNLYVQGMGLALILNFLLYRRKENLIAGVAAVAVAGAGFIAINLDTISYGIIHGKNPSATPRGYFQLEMFALKPLELVIPPATHHSEVLADMGRKYASSAWVRGEMFSPYLGMVGIIALLWLGFEFGKYLLGRQRSPRYLPPHLPTCAWVVLYSVIGGFNCIIGLCGILYFRASNRYSLFISATCLLFAASAMSRVTRRLSFPARWGLAIAVVGFGLWDQLPRSTTPAETAAATQKFEADRAFGAELEAHLAPGTMVFQLPVMRFPEGGPVGEITEYEMLRPYFFTKTLRFSFGSNQGRPREEWQFEIEGLKPEDAIGRLEKFGFGALYINRKGRPGQAEAFLAAAQKLGRSQNFEDSTGSQLCIVLQPSPNPELPHSDDYALVRFHRGVALEEHTKEGVRHWLSGDGTFSFFSEDPQPRTFALSMVVATLTSRRVEIEYDGQIVWKADMQAGQGAPVQIEVEGKHGYNYFHVHTDRLPESPRPDTVRVSVGIVGPEVKRLR